MGGMNLRKRWLQREQVARKRSEYELNQDYRISIHRSITPSSRAFRVSTMVVVIVHNFRVLFWRKHKKPAKFEVDFLCGREICALVSREIGRS